MLDLLVEDIRNEWNPKRYQTPHGPYVVGTVSPELVLSPKDDVLDMPIKLPHGDFVISMEDDVKKIVEMCVNFEREINPDWQDYHCYLTMNQGTVRHGETQRNPGVHFDGMQGVRYEEKLKACHQYLVSSALPTTFYVQPFDASDLDSTKHNWFKAFEEQARAENRYFPNPFELALMTAYCPHAATPAEEPTERTFIRVEFSLKQFNRLGNSKNPQLETGWTYEPQPIPEHLI
jgi:hypothetical protein